MIKTHLKTVFTITLLLLPTTSRANDAVIIQNLWINEGPPNIKVLAAYGQITNHGETDIILQNISNPSFKRIEIHQSLIEDDVAKMQRQSELIIKAQSSIKLEPGGLHIMLFDPDKPLKSGDSFLLDFEFSNDKKLSVTAMVKKHSSSNNHNHHHH